MATRGFTGRLHRERDPRLPPGQYDVGSDWPVLTAEATPRLDPDRWTMTVDGLVENAHTWSKLATSFSGVSVDLLLAAARPQPTATHVLATSTTGYTTNLPLSHINNGQAWIVWSHEGKPLSREHGGPVRLLVPHLYFWKSAKWVTQLTLLDHDQSGFWERNGYHDLGDPWLEQRYQGD
jgi:DMSO/TMAO reductase YedYZ molybdopterin-dependent catalytic subunit